MKQNILIVEDHELTRFGLKTTFEGVVILKISMRQILQKMQFNYLIITK